MQQRMGFTFLWLCAFGVASASAHGGLFRGPEGGKGSMRPPAPPSSPTPPPSGPATGPSGRPNSFRSAGSQVAKPVIFPGSGPEIPFSEGRWEFWWEFNQDAFTQLRETLVKNGNRLPGTPSFQLPSNSDRHQVILPALLNSLREKNFLVRSSAAYALARLDDLSVYSYLGHTMHEDSSRLVRDHTLVATGQARVPRSVDRLREIFSDTSAPDETRALAAVALGVLATPEASAALRNALRDSKEGEQVYTVRIATIYALGLTEDPANAPFLRAQAVAGERDFTRRALLMEALGRVGDRAANPILVKALQDPHSYVRRSAAIALGVLAQPADLDVLKALDRAALSDADHMVRNLSDLSLGRIAAHGSLTVREHLRSRFREVPAVRRSFVALALGISQDSMAVPLLLAEFQSSGSHSLKGACAVALAMIGKGKDAVPVLRKAFRRAGNPMLKGYLAYALGMLGDQEVREDLGTVLDEEVSPELLRWASIGLGLLGDRSAVQRLMNRYAASGEVLTRATSVHAIGLIGDRESIDFLIATSQRTGEVASVRAMAAYSLGLICDQGPEPLPAIYSRDHNYTLSLSFLPELYYLF